MLTNLKDILKIAQQKKIAIGCFNTPNFESLDAVISAAEDLNVPVIIAHAEVHNKYIALAKIGPHMLTAAKLAKVPVCVHLDHGVTLGCINEAINLGFTSVMFDGSKLPYEENLKTITELTKYVHSKNISIEGELGRTLRPDHGDEDKSEFDDASLHYTQPSQAKKYTDVSGIDALAIAFGTAHGVYEKPPVLNLDIITKVKKVIDTPLVMHGASGLSEEEFKQTIKYGITKINYYTYMAIAGFKAAKKYCDEKPNGQYHELAVLARDAMYQDIYNTLKVFSLK